MKRIWIVLLVLLGLGYAKENTFSLQVETGWFNGLSGEIGLGIFNIEGEKVGARFGIAYSLSDAVNDQAAAAAGVTPTKESAQNISLSLDVSYSFDFQSAFTLTPYAGGRFNLFSGYAKLGLPEGPISSNQFGLGTGVRAGWFVDNQFSALVDLGLDYYFDAVIDAAGTRYNPGDNIPSSTVKAHDFFATPKLVFKVRVGLAFNF